MNFLSRLFGLPLEEFNDWAVRFGSDYQLGVWVIAMIFIPTALWFFWASLFRIRSTFRKCFLFSMRVMAFVSLVLVIFRPELEFKKVEKLKNTLSVLLDDSKSMSIKTFPEDKPRQELIRQILNRNRRYLKDLRQSFQVEFYFASDRLVPVAFNDIEARYNPKAENTDLSQVLSELKKRNEDKSLQGVLLFTDGADLAEDPEEVSPEMLELLASFRVPIHAFQTGSNNHFKDLGIEKLDGPDFGFIFQPIRLTVNVSASAIGNKNISVVVKEGGKVLLSKILSIRDGLQRYQTGLEFVPASLGKRVYRVSVPVFAGESIEINNRKEFQVKVVRDRIRVLHLNGRPSWDSRFLREVLINNPKVDLLSFFILRTLSDDVAAATSELSLIPFPSNLLLRDYLDSFDLVVFHNFKYAPFIEKKYLENIRQYVHNGGAFIMIGGDLSFQGGGYGHTPVEEILPFRFRGDTQSYQHVEFQPRVRKNLIHHPLLRLEKNREILPGAWESLPLLDGFNRGLETVKGAQSLIVHKKDKPQPILAVRKYGQGRTMALATDSSWHWNFLRVGQGGSGRYYQKFWSNVIAWMTGHPETHTLTVETDKERYRVNEKTLIKINALGEDYNPSEKEAIRLTLATVFEKRVLETHSLETDAEGDAVFEYEPPGEGFYSVRVGRGPKGEKDTREIRFGVFAQTAEFEKPLINANLLQTMAKVTGGSYRKLDEKTSLKELVFPNPEVRVKTKSHRLTLWDNWWSYGFIVGFLFLDWWLRRKWGLS